MSASPHPVAMVLMGVSGSGKTTIGELIAQRAAMVFLDGDDLHPPENKAKMASGQPLNDDDRRPWLTDVGNAAAELLNQGISIVVACSALKRKYRDWLREQIPTVVFIHLQGQEGSIAARIAGRTHEYMPASLLESQLTALEPLGPTERGIAVSIDESPNAIVERIMAAMDDWRG